MARGQLVACACAIVAIVGSTRAARAEFAWRAPAGCPGEAEVRARIASRLDGDTLPDATIVVRRDDRGFVARIEAGGSARGADGDGGAAAATGEAPEHGGTAADAGGDAAAADAPRTLVGASCDELADAVAVIVARFEPPAVPLRREPALRAVAVDPTPGAPPRARWWHVGARAATLAGACVVPGVGVGGELAAFVRAGPASVELGAARWLAGSAQIAHPNVERIDTDLTVATMRLAGHLATVPLRGWLVGELGAMTGTGMSVLDGRRTGSARWAAIGAGFGTAWHVARAVAIVGAVEALAAVARPSFTLSDGTMLYEPPRVSGRAWAGVEVGW